MRLLPREEKFFRFFESQVRLIVEATATLKAGLADRNLRDATERIRALEREGDAVKHQIVDKLHSTFITPLDPEDIHNLASSLDGVLNVMEELAHRIYFYHLDCLPEPAMRIVDLLDGAARTLEGAFLALSRNQSPKEPRIEINRAEHEMHLIAREAIGALFDNESNLAVLMKLRDIYRVLERVADKLEEVADMLEYVIVKNG